MIYTVLFNRGDMALMKAADADRAKNLAYYVFGARSAPFTIRPATEEDKAWYAGMGGYIHEDQEGETNVS